jgi:hypothetical protein
MVTPPWRSTNPVRSTVASFMSLGAAAFPIAAFRFIGRDDQFAFTALMAGVPATIFLATLIRPRSRWRALSLLMWGFLLVTWALLLVNTSRPVR